MSQVILQNKIQKDYSVFKSLVDGGISLVTQDMIEGITKIDDYAFYKCETLTSIQIPNSVTDIKSYSFSGCSSLTNLMLPSTVTSIGNGAFQIYSDPQRIITLLSVTLPTATSIGPFNCPTNNLTIYVPAESVETYKSATGWSQCADKIQPIPT